MIIYLAGNLITKHEKVMCDGTYPRLLSFMYLQMAIPVHFPRKKKRKRRKIKNEQSKTTKKNKVNKKN